MAVPLNEYIYKKPKASLSNEAFFFMKIIYSLYSVFLVGIILFPVINGSLYDSKRIYQLSVLVIIVISYSYYSIRYDIKSIVVVKPKYLYLAAVILLFGLISAFINSSTSFSLFEIIFKLSLLLLALLLIPVNNESLKILQILIFTSATLFAILYTVLFIPNYIQSLVDDQVPLWPEKFVNYTLNNGDNVRVYFQEKDVLYFLNRRFFNHVQTYTFPILLGTFVIAEIKQKVWFKNILLFLISFWWMLLFASGGRGTIFGFSLGFILLFIFFKRDVRHYIRVLLKSIFFGFTLYFILFLFLPEESNNQSLIRSSSSGRYQIWVYAFQLWLDNPILGIGPYGFSKINDIVDIATTHNVILTLMTEWGVIVTIISIFFIWSLLKTSRYNYNKYNDSTFKQVQYLSICWSLYSGLFHALVSGIYETPLGQMWGVVLISWIMGINQTHSSLDNYNFKIDKKYVSLIIILMLTIILCFLIFKLEFPSDLGKPINFPRFWEQGKFHS